MILWESKIARGLYRDIVRVLEYSTVDRCDTLEDSRLPKKTQSNNWWHMTTGKISLLRGSQLRISCSFAFAPRGTVKLLG